jgi:hypothetical protein
VLRQLIAGRPISPERGGVSGGSVTRPGETPKTSLDESSKESFPGSDPPAY